MLTAPNSRPLPLAPAMALTPPVTWKVVSIRRPFTTQFFLVVQMGEDRPVVEDQRARLIDDVAGPTQ